jgi:hypothetical protein
MHKSKNLKELNTRTTALDLLNCFGNLCLISDRLSNHMPKAKRIIFCKPKTKNSIKQIVMMSEKNILAGKLTKFLNTI